MADTSDVEQALVGLISGILYPTGLSGNPPLAAIGAPCRVFRGWPEQAALDADMRAGVVNVNVWPRPNMERLLPGYFQDDPVATLNPATYTATVAGQTITIGGAAPTTYYAQNFAALVNGAAYLYQATAGQTAAQVAAALAAVIGAGVPGTSVAGAVITLPTAARLTAARIGSSASTAQEVGRMQKQYMIGLWCPTPALRDAAAKLIDPNLRATSILTMADGTAGRLTYHASNLNDAPQKEILFRRDLFVAVEYSVTLAGVAYQIVTETLNLDDPTGAVLASKIA